MKVLLYSHSFAPNIGGVETYVMSLARGLATDATQVVVVTKTPNIQPGDALLPFEVVRRPGLMRLCRLIAESDILHLAGPCLGPLLLSLLLRKPAIVEHHGYQACCPNGLLLHKPDLSICDGHFLKTRYDQCFSCEATRLNVIGSLKSVLFTAIRKKLCGAAAQNVMVSHHVAKRLELVRSRVIYHGVADCQVEPGHTGGIVTFGYIGRMVAEKGLPVLITAAEKLKAQNYEFRLHIIGDGPERSSLEQRCAEAGLSDRVTFTGTLTGAHLSAAVRRIDALVVPSICEETAGLAAMEQMMRGRTVLAADVGGLRDIMDGAGARFTPGDPVHLAQCMRELIKHPVLLRELGVRARERAQKMFRAERMAAEHRELYIQILAAAH